MPALNRGGLDVSGLDDGLDESLCCGSRDAAADEGEPGRETSFGESRHPVPTSPFLGSFAESRDKPGNLEKSAPIRNVAESAGHVGARAGSRILPG
jgi:hypothetical protein